MTAVRCPGDSSSAPRSRLWWSILGPTTLPTSSLIDVNRGMLAFLTVLQLRPLRAVLPDDCMLGAAPEAVEALLTSMKLGLALLLYQDDGREAQLHRHVLAGGDLPRLAVLANNDGVVGPVAMHLVHAVKQRGRAAAAELFAVVHPPVASVDVLQPAVCVLPPAHLAMRRGLLALRQRAVLVRLRGVVVEGRAEALQVSALPLEVVEQGPREEALDGDLVDLDGHEHLLRVVGIVLDAPHVLHALLCVRCGEGPAGFRHDDVVVGVAPVNPVQDLAEAPGSAV
mmetsp:Transcript_92514/g.238830  ORF Transcript_92514/g.238830 Transcript_92514/m.238830 type:complete len:283 (-) Transcript_92514:1635-2483(-)